MSGSTILGLHEFRELELQGDVVGHVELFDCSARQAR
jgi:hypothetical protein